MKNIIEIDGKKYEQTITPVKEEPVTQYKKPKFIVTDVVPQNPKTPSTQNLRQIKYLNLINK